MEMIVNLKLLSKPENPIAVKARDTTITVFCCNPDAEVDDTSFNLSDISKAKGL